MMLVGSVEFIIFVRGRYVLLVLGKTMHVVTGIAC